MVAALHKREVALGRNWTPLVGQGIALVDTDPDIPAVCHNGRGSGVEVLRWDR